MTFHKIKDFDKRDELVNEYLALRNNLRERNIERKLGIERLQENSEKLFKPIIDEVKESNRRIEKPQQALEKLAIEETPTNIISLGHLPLKYTSNKKDYDMTFGVRHDNDKFYIGNREVKIDDNNITIPTAEGESIIFEGTEGLWELLNNKEPKNYTEDDYNNYKEIMKITGALKNNETGKLKSSGGKKWKGLLKNIAKEIYEVATGEGIYLSCDPNRLLERLDLLVSSKKAGNTGVNQEIRAVINQLYKNKVIDKDSLKILYKNVLL